MRFCRCKSGGSGNADGNCRDNELPDREHVSPGVHPGSQDQSACALDCQELFRLAVFALHGHTLASNLQIPQIRGKSTRSDPYKGDGVAGLGRLPATERDRLRDE
jgi:hypothetical protein